jgi:hypothetical protein
MATDILQSDRVQRTGGAGRDPLSDRAELHSGMDADRIGQSCMGFPGFHYRFTEHFPENNCSNCLTPQSLGLTKMPRIPTSSNRLRRNSILDLYSSIIGGTWPWNTETN